MLGLEDGDKLVAAVTLLLAIATAASVVIAVQMNARQEKLQKSLAAEAAEREHQHIELQKQMALQQRLFEQRAHLLPLWQYMSSLSDINSLKPITPDVVSAVNTLEFIAVCCEAEVVDRAVVMRTFREKYIYFYDKIAKCGNLPGYTNPTKNGEELLKENKAAQKLYGELQHERLAADALSPIVKKKE
jgi:hypothetical protein